jgi:hypothetical protein
MQGGGAVARGARGLFRGASVWRVAFGAYGFIGAFGLTAAELETPGALQGGGGVRSRIRRCGRKE